MMLADVTALFSPTVGEELNVSSANTNNSAPVIAVGHYGANICNNTASTEITVLKFALFSTT